jgi:zinc finger MYND domain-containing protein 10
MEYTQSTLSPAEAEILVRQLKPISIDRVGTPEWKDQRLHIEQLNMCSHSNAALKKDDFVRSFMIEHEKLPILLHELLVMEVWRQRIQANVEDEIIANPSAAYLYTYYESVILNFFECVMYFEESVTAIGDDILELIDYCWRQVSGYCGNNFAVVSRIEEPADPKSPEDAKTNFKRQQFQQESTRAMTSISCLWFVVERMTSLSMAVSNNILLKNDLVLGFAEVMTQQIWLRRGPGKVQKYVQGQFREVAADDVPRICVPEAHSWFILHKLLCDRDCRSKYTYTAPKKEIILRIKRHLNEVVVDQIPALADVQRGLEELSFLEPPSGTEEKFKSTLIIEQLPRLMGSIDNSHTNWSALAREMHARLRDPNSRRDDAMRLASVFDAMFDLNSRE